MNVKKLGFGFMRLPRKAFKGYLRVLPVDA